MPGQPATRTQNPLQDHPRYLYVKPLSDGAFGSVHLFTDTSAKQPVAIKFVDRADRHNPNIERELLNHRRLDHPHVIQFREVFLTADHICIVMEYASGGCLFDYVKRAGRLSEGAARWIFQQLLVALDYCHRCGVVNRDVKLENTLLHHEPGVALPLVKLCDFGYSKSDIQSAPHTRVGTVPYMAPEVIQTRPGESYDGAAADIWSCGVMLYAMLFGRYPFDDPQGPANPQARDAAIFRRIVRVQWSIPADARVSAPCRDLLCGLLVGDPMRRLTMAQIQQHAWFVEDLPRGVREMNEAFIRGGPPDRPGLQSELSIRDVIAAAPLREGPAAAERGA